MKLQAAFPADAAHARRARRALDTYRNTNGSGDAKPRELIALLLADLAHLAAEYGVNYGALIAHAQASWLHATVNAERLRPNSSRPNQGSGKMVADLAKLMPPRSPAVSKRQSSDALRPFVPG